jgi:hypothetical protein
MDLNAILNFLKGMKITPTWEMLVGAVKAVSGGMSITEALWYVVFETHKADVVAKSGLSDAQAEAAISALAQAIG